jgi:hypothetical protein
MKLKLKKNKLQGKRTKVLSGNVSRNTIPPLQSFSPYSLHQDISNIVRDTKNTMTILGHFPGVLTAMWAELSIYQNQPSCAMRLFWKMRDKL